MSKYWYKSFVLSHHNYCLLDVGGDIRATADDIEGIMLAKQYYGWGKVHKMTFKDKIIKIGKEVK